jgi:hypothetical protein
VHYKLVVVLVGLMCKQQQQQWVQEVVLVNWR